MDVRMIRFKTVTRNYYTYPNLVWCILDFNLSLPQCHHFFFVWQDFHLVVIDQAVGFGHKTQGDAFTFVGLGSLRMMSWVGDCLSIGSSDLGHPVLGHCFSSQL
jgi:hypothetical protein